MSNRNVGMSSELEAIMKQRLAKSEVKSEEEFFDAIEEDDKEISAINSNINAREPKINPTHSTLSNEKKLHKNSEFSKRIAMFNRSSSIEPKSTDTDHDISEVKKNIAKFNRVASPRPFDEDDRAFIHKKPDGFTKVTSSSSDPVQTASPLNIELTQTVSKNSNDSDEVPIDGTVKEEASISSEVREPEHFSIADLKDKFHKRASLSSVSNEQATIINKNTRDNEGFLDINPDEDDLDNTSNTSTNLIAENVFETAFEHSDDATSNVDAFSSNLVSDNDFHSFGKGFSSVAAPQDIDAKFEDWTEVNEPSENDNDWGWGDNPFHNAVMHDESSDIKHSFNPHEKTDHMNAMDSSFRFDAFSRKSSYSDDSDEETLMVGDTVPETEASTFSTLDLCLGLDIEKGSSLIANNPLNNNVILCRKSKKSWILEEYNTSSSSIGSIVRQHELNCSEIRKLDSSSILELKDNMITNISDVLFIACGTYSDGRKGGNLRITAITSVSLLGRPDTFTIGITLNWGQSPNGKSELEHVYSLPEDSKKSVLLNSMSLSIDQDVLFLGYLNANVPSLYIMRLSKPNIWSAQNISSTNAGLVNISIDRASKVLALSTTDGLLSVWNYEGFLTGKTKLLANHCVIEASSLYGGGLTNLFANSDSLEDVNDSMQSDTFICDSMSWVPVESNFRELYGILAVSHSQGIVVLIIHLQKRNYWRILAGATLPNSHKVYMSNVTWLNIGSNSLPLVCASFRTANHFLICAAFICVPSFCEAVIPNNGGFQMKPVFETAIHTPHDPIKSSTHILFPAAQISSLILYHHGVVQLLKPSWIATAECVRMSQTITSSAIGVNSEGSPISSLDGLVHIKKTIEFDADPDHAEMMPLPAYRYWLVLSNIGDSNYTCSEDLDGHLDEFPKGGVISKEICEIRCIDTVTKPHRIQLSEDKKYSIVLFIKNDEKQASFLNVIDVHKGVTLILLPGVDSFFFGSGSEMKLVVLREDGVLNIYPFSYILNNQNSTESIHSSAIFQESSANCNNIRIHRIFQTRTGNLLLVGSRKFDKRQCIFVGSSVKTLSLSSKKAVVRGKTKKIWFDDNEEILNLCSLNTFCDLITTVGVVTTNRVAILSFDDFPKIISETRTSVLSSELAPLGSNCVAYITSRNSNETRIQYLSSFDGEFKNGLLTVIPSQCNFMIGIRQDRFVLGNERLVWRTFDEENSLSSIFSRPLIKPALLLEPLLINAMCFSSDIDFRKMLCEKFGYRFTSSPHGDSEGIGCLGIGVSPKIKKILGTSYDYIFPTIDTKDPCLTQKKTLLRDISNSVGHHKDGFLSKTFDETKHVWCRGPFDKKEELLLLDKIDEWMGKSRPNILGKAGVQASEEKGKQTLQNILAIANMKQEKDPSEMTENKEGISSRNYGWKDGVGSGLNAEENLSLYLRFSEGTEDDAWRENGIKDLSKYNSSVSLVQDKLFDICQSSSNVDEGEPGKVRALNDLVAQQNISQRDHAGLAVNVPRGSGLDVGMFHSSLHSSRQRASIELWFRIPTADFADEVILIRRSLCNDEDVSSHCAADDRDSMLWELVLIPSGHIEFRAVSGSSLSSKKANEHGTEDVGIVILPRDDHYGGWNHVSVIFSCQDVSRTQCKVSLTMKGKLVASSILTIIDEIRIKETMNDDLDHLLKSSALYFGLGAMKGFRMTEIRAWCCERAVDDIRLNMYEYLDIARGKKKLKVSIRSKGNTKSVKRGALFPLRTVEKKGFHLATPLKDTSHVQHISEEESLCSGASFADFTSMTSMGEGYNRGENGTSNLQVPENDVPKTALENYLEPSSLYHPPSDEEMASNAYEKSTGPQNLQNDGKCSDTTAYTQSRLISEDIRKSAAAALIRGPPATRHFGGNRGGSTRLENELVSVSSVCVCGSEKTVVYSPMSESPARTYPIGASGAIISDKIQGSEYLCCFTAKEKRVIVFDLTNKIVVVELQMTTKLNFWRYLPTSINSKRVKFILITPIGGFHWMPLDESPKPQQVWRRGDDLASKKILSYEEGGNNGKEQEEHNASVGLILASSDDCLETWVVSIAEGFTSLCLSKDVLGCCLVNTQEIGGRYEPLVCVVSSGLSDSHYRVSLFKIESNVEEKAVFSTGCIANDTICFNKHNLLEPPTMAMGESPPVLCLHLHPYIVIIIRDKGHVFKFKYIQGSLLPDGDVLLERYVVDAAITTSGGPLTSSEIIALVSEGDRDGRIIRMVLQS